MEFRGESTTVWQNRERVTLNSETYGLNFHPVTAGDTGDYHCLVNNRPLPESINKLVVQGKSGHVPRPLVITLSPATDNLIPAYLSPDQEADAAFPARTWLFAGRLIFGGPSRLPPLIRPRRDYLLRRVEKAEQR